MIDADLRRIVRGDLAKCRLIKLVMDDLKKERGLDDCSRWQQIALTSR